MTDAVFDSILAMLQNGAPAEAERLCRNHLQHSPDSVDALAILGMSLHQQGKLEEAARVLGRLTRLDPANAVHWGNYATVLHAAGDFEAAERAAETAASLAPNDVERLDQLGRYQLQRGKPLAARETLSRAFRRAPDLPAVQIDLARACAACRDYRAEDLVRRWREWLPLDDALQLDLANVFAPLGELEEAIEVLEDLLRRAPSFRPAQLQLVNIYERVNRVEEARALLDRISNGEIGPELQLEIIRLRGQLAARDREYAKARQLMEQAGAREADDYAYWFALALVRDKLGDTAGAMEALKLAHAAQRNELQAIAPFVLEKDAIVLPGAKWRVSEKDYDAWPRLAAPETSQSPVFVVGFPRSGTTLLEQMLDAHPLLQSMDERPFFNILSNQLEEVGIEIPKDLAKLTQRDCDELRKGYVYMACSKVPRRWNSRLVDKNPMNLLWLPMIHRLFPRAKFILAIRHPCDVVLSCYMQNFRSIPLSSASLSLERLAHAYVSTMESWLHHVEVFKPDVFHSRYEDLVADTPAQTRRIATFLDLDEPQTMLGFAERAREKGYIRTPSYTQVIEPISQRALGRWQRYREYFEPVLPILQPMLEHWQYDAGTGAVAAAH